MRSHLFFAGRERMNDARQTSVRGIRQRNNGLAWQLGWICGCFDDKLATLTISVMKTGVVGIRGRERRRRGATASNLRLRTFLPRKDAATRCDAHLAKNCCEKQTALDSAWRGAGGRHHLRPGGES